ncbi:MAG: hypothetical protein GF416_04200 [Candidatus Altiarchaeales archaeon]|nr:hypothetical protein [Candidatus Altiarchaeales archaeon]MBD3416322.1 hypothetical protein [Candidatus Altiarchaeales archaeon]
MVKPHFSTGHSGPLNTDEFHVIPAMKPVVEDIGEMTVVGVKGRCNYATTMEDIPPLWKKLMMNEHSIKNKVDGPAYGVHTTIDDQSCYAMACFEVSQVEDVPDGMVGEAIPAMKVAKFTHEGRMEGLKDTYDKIMKEWMPAEGLELDYSKPCIEMYDDRFKEDSDESICEIWMAVK